MAKVLVIPDTHLKPKMFDLADRIMRENDVDYAVQLGDNVDDFYCFDEQYRNHYARMLAFYRKHPDTVWLWGNHEVSYVSDRPVTGNVYAGKEYAYLYRENFNPKIVHLDGKVVFSHAGIFQEFLEANGLLECGTAEELVERINGMDLSAFWRDDSPLWARPQYNEFVWPSVLNGYWQVIGHTPMKDIVEIGGLISVDAFSTNWGKKLGIEKMIIIDTEKLAFKVVDIDYRGEFGEEG
ncbi:metallophosphoesterase [Candidatus Saccharibacteria bacterium]|nr:metallophosphoesterase [Candidatus Saccharibacteria bacterium]MBQ6375705.1 metallophosphoesterase [Candidatus Saccharibacteria bacterium]